MEQGLFYWALTWNCIELRANLKLHRVESPLVPILRIPGIICRLHEYFSILQNMDQITFLVLYLLEVCSRYSGTAVVKNKLQLTIPKKMFFFLSRSSHRLKKCIFNLAASPKENCILCLCGTKKMLYWAEKYVGSRSRGIVALAPRQKKITVGGGTRFRFSSELFDIICGSDPLILRLRKPIFCVWMERKVSECMFILACELSQNFSIEFVAPTLQYCGSGSQPSVFEWTERWVDACLS